MLRFIASALRGVRRFGSARKGATAVEFALVAPWFFLLTFGLAEVAMIGFAQTTLDFATSETARLIRTGQAQSAGTSASDIKKNLCTQLTRLMPMDCDANLFLDVNRFNSFVTVQNNNPVQNGNFNSGTFGYNPGQPSDIVVVRAYYKWKVITPFFQGVFANVTGGQRVLASTLMFRNEPYSGAVGP